MRPACPKRREETNARIHSLEHFTATQDVAKHRRTLDSQLAGHNGRAANAGGVANIKNRPLHDPCLAAALAGKAAVLVTYDRDLLTLEKPFEIQIVRPSRFLQMI